MSAVVYPCRHSERPIEIGVGIEIAGMRRFVLFRHRDISGISGTGVVADGHGGATSIEWLDR